MGWSSAYAVTLAERITLNYLSYFDFWGILIRNDNHSTDTTIKNTHSNSTINTNLDSIPHHWSNKIPYWDFESTRIINPSFLFPEYLYTTNPSSCRKKKTSPRSQRCPTSSTFLFLSRGFLIHRLRWIWFFLTWKFQCWDLDVGQVSDGKTGSRPNLKISFALWKIKMEPAKCFFGKWTSSTNHRFLGLISSRKSL